MCSSGGKVAQNDQALQDSEIAANKVYLADYNTSFAENQTVLAQQKARLDAEVSNPMGYTPAQLHSATTSINENTATAAKQAIGAASAFAAAHGSSDIGGGAIGAEAGRIGSTAALAKAGELSSLSQQNEAIKQERMQAGLAGLSQVGAGYEAAAGGATTGSGMAAKGTVEAGTGVNEAQTQAWKNFGSILGTAGSAVSTIAGL